MAEAPWWMKTLEKTCHRGCNLIKTCWFKPIIVHGGGKEISKWVEKAGMKPQFINGLRVTDADTMEVAEMVLGKVNKSLVQLVESLGVRAIGISGKDGGLLKVGKETVRRRRHRICGGSNAGKR